MKINFIKSENVIEIDDNIKARYFSLGMALLALLVQSLISFYKILNSGMDYFHLAVIVLGVFLTIKMLPFLIKKSYLKKINLKDVVNFNAKTIFGKRVYSFKLKNGKDRDLDFFADEYQMAETLKLVKGLGLRMSV